MAGRSGDGVELNVFVLRRALHDSIEAEESLEQGKLEFRDAKSGSVSSWAKRREGGEGEYGRGGLRTRAGNRGKRGGVGDMAEESEHGTRGRNIYCHLLYHLPTDSLPELVNTS